MALRSDEHLSALPISIDLKSCSYAPTWYNTSWGTVRALQVCMYLMLWQVSILYKPYKPVRSVTCTRPHASLSWCLHCHRVTRRPICLWDIMCQSLKRGARFEAWLSLDLCQLQIESKSLKKGLAMKFHPKTDHLDAKLQDYKVVRHTYSFTSQLYKICTPQLGKPAISSNHETMWLSSIPWSWVSLNPMKMNRLQTIRP